MTGSRQFWFNHVKAGRDQDGAEISTRSPAAVQKILINELNIIVQMKSSGAAGIMVFEPAFVSAAVGDTDHFMPTDPGHNAPPITGMLPDGVAVPMGGMNKIFILKLVKPGIYGIKCTPRFSMGMVAPIKAGTGPASNAAAVTAVTLPPLAAKRMLPLLALTK